MTVVMAGCGDLGTETGLRLAALGHRVIGLRRSAEKLPSAIEGQSVDLSVEAPTLPADTDIVVIAMAPDERSADGYRSAYVDSVRRVAQAIERDCTESPRVMFVSSTAVYGVDDGGPVDESTPTEPTSPTAVVLLEAEQTVRELLPEATLLRLGGIYGPGRTRQIDRIRDGVETIPAVPKFANQIHRDDAAAAVVHLMTMQNQPEPVYVGVDDYPVERREILEFLAGRLGLPVPPVAAARDGDEPSRGKRCDNSRLRESGFEFTYPTFREGYDAVLNGGGVRHP